MQSFAQDRIPEPGFDRLGDDQVDPAPEEVLQVSFEIHVRVERLPLEFDDEVEVALLLGRTARGRVKQTEPAGAMASDGVSISFQ